MEAKIDAMFPAEIEEAAKRRIDQKADPLQRQEGGAHYMDLAIQPIEFIHANGLPFIEGNIVKLASRHRNKGKADDIRKIIHYCELLLKLEYGVEKQG